MYTQSDITRELEAVVLKRRQKDPKKISSSFKAEMEKKIASLKVDILITYRNQMVDIFTEKLTHYYGRRVNLSQVDRSLSFSLTPNLEPTCFFNSAALDIQITSQDKETFNQNAVEDYAFMDLADAFGGNIEDSVFGEDLVFDFIDTYGDDDYSYNGLRGGKMIIEPSQVFQEAKDKADVRYKLIFESQIKPKYL